MGHIEQGAAASGGGGGTPTLAIGQSVEILIIAAPVASVGTWINQFIAAGAGDTGEPFASPWNSSNTQNDSATWHVNLPAGTYDIDYTMRITPNDAIHTVKIDGTQVAAFDGFAASGGSSAFRQTGVVVATSGDHALSITAATHNVSSTSWQLQPTRVVLTRRA